MWANSEAAIATGLYLYKILSIPNIPSSASHASLGLPLLASFWVICTTKTFPWLPKSITFQVNFLDLENSLPSLLVSHGSCMRQKASQECLTCHL